MFNIYLSGFLNQIYQKIKFILKMLYSFIYAFFFHRLNASTYRKRNEFAKIAIIATN